MVCFRKNFDRIRNINLGEVLGLRFFSSFFFFFKAVLKTKIILLCRPGAFALELMILWSQLELLIFILAII